MIAAILMKFSTRYTNGSLHNAEAATLRLLSAYRLLDDLHSMTNIQSGNANILDMSVFYIFRA